MKKFFLINIMIVVFIMGINIQPVLADGESTSSMFDGADEFLSSAESQADNKSLQDFSNILSNAFIGIGTAVAVIYATILGIKYMIGSIEEKAEIKESLVPFIIGCIVLFGAFGIWKMVVKIGNSL